MIPVISFQVETRPQLLSVFNFKIGVIECLVIYKDGMEWYIDKPLCMSHAELVIEGQKQVEYWTKIAQKEVDTFDFPA
jgi:hypothetical protein